MATKTNAPRGNAPKATAPGPPPTTTPGRGFKLPTFAPLATLSPQRRAQVAQLAALVAVVVGLYLLVACVSYLGAGPSDQSLVQGGLPALGAPGQAPSNRAGAFGAFLAHLLIGGGFGLSGLCVPLLLLCWGVGYVGGTTRAWLWAALPYLVFAWLWVCGLFGFLTQVLTLESWVWGGAVGHWLNTRLALYIGYTGAGIWWVFLAVAFFIFKPTRLPQLSWLAQRMAFGATTPVGVETPQATTGETVARHTDHQPDDPESDDDDELEGSFIVSVRKAPTTDTLGATHEAHPEAAFLDPPLPRTPLGPTPNGHHIEPEFVIETAPPETPSFEVNVVATGEDSFVKDIDGSDQESLDGAEGVADWTPYDPTLQLSRYQYPPVELLRAYEDSSGSEVSRAELEANKNKIVGTLQQYNIEITSIKATIGPTVTLYEIVPAPGIRINKIKGLEDDIALSLSALGIRIIAPIPGRGTIGIEIPNSKPETVSLRSVVATEKFRDTKAELPIAIGRTISNEVYVADLTRMPHLLVAGATGQGKSVGLNCILASLLYKKHPSQVKFVLIDPKKVEMTLYQLLEKHFLAKLPNYPDAIITDTKQVVHVLTSLCLEMDDRYELLKQARVRNIKEYNAKFAARRLNPRKGHRYLPYIVLVIDELADLMMTAGKEVEMPIARLAQLARAVGIHLVVATQRPSVNVITGIIKANFPYRLSYRVISKIDSRTILDANGADQLIGRGDLLLSTGTDILRIQNAFVDTPEVEALVEFIGNQQGFTEPYYLPEVHDPEADDDPALEPGELDPLFAEAARLVVRSRQGSTSMLQRKYSIGYNRAGRLMDQLARAGIVGEASGSKPREVLVGDEAELEQLLNALT
ncbi:MAG: DNA translocase FtsK [Bacteroidia bacterium]|nr:DNA translocase FtsK [Bacteroidia bacterium]